jgi:uncharacterized protein (DUF1778 family)
MTTPKENTVRFTIDLPIDQHKYIKMMATIEGISLRQFVIDRLPSPEASLKEISRDDFRQLMLEFTEENHTILERLAKK